MNVNFHISRYKFLMILVAMLFVLLVIKAFTYLPENQGDAFFMQNAKNKMSDATVRDENSDDESDAEVYITTDTIDRAEEDSEQINEQITEAESYRGSGFYDKSLSMYSDVLKKVRTPDIYAKCYDGISKIYEAQKNYEKALYNAKLAFQYEPNDLRKLSLARLYHKIGNVEQERILVEELLETNNPE